MFCSTLARPTGQSFSICSLNAREALTKAERVLRTKIDGSNCFTKSLIWPSAVIVERLYENCQGSTSSGVNFCRFGSAGVTARSRGQIVASQWTMGAASRGPNFEGATTNDSSDGDARRTGLTQLLRVLKNRIAAGS